MASVTVHSFEHVAPASTLVTFSLEPGRRVTMLMPTALTDPGTIEALRRTLESAQREPPSSRVPRG